jgi:hypothetical protein
MPNRESAPLVPSVLPSMASSVPGHPVPVLRIPPSLKACPPPYPAPSTRARAHPDAQRADSADRKSCIHVRWRCYFGPAAHIWGGGGEEREPHSRRPQCTFTGSTVLALSIEPQCTFTGSTVLALFIEPQCTFTGSTVLALLIEPQCTFTTPDGTLLHHSRSTRWHQASLG